MAGTRRQSRARDTANTHKRQQSASQVVSGALETAAATNAIVSEIAESADGGSPNPEVSSQPETAINRSVAAFCKTCNGNIGDFYNSWHKVTSSYYSPALLGSYKSMLRVSDRRKEASDSTELAGCTIDLTCCPGCNSYLGFVVVDTPADRKKFRGREFFKLQHINLRCEISPNVAIIVEPHENVAPDLIVSEAESFPPTKTETVSETMELETPLSSSHPLWTKPAQSEQQSERRQSHPRGTDAQSFQSNVSLPPIAVSRSPASRSLGGMDIASLTAPSKASPPQVPQQQPGSTFRSSAPNTQSMPAINGHNDGVRYPQDPRDVHFDAIARLQTQTSQNTSALAAQARTQVEAADIVRQIESSLRNEFQGLLQRQDQELRRMSETVNQLVRELTDCRQTMAALGHEVHIARTESARRSSDSLQPGYQDDALELMARRIGEVAHRTTDLETLRDHVSIIGGKVHRLESESANARQAHPQQTHPVNQPAPPTLVAQAAPVQPHQAPTFQTPARTTSIPQVIATHEKASGTIPPESAQRHEFGTTQNGWATINAGVKRVFDNVTNSPRQGASSAPGSPKRPKLSTGESQDGQALPQPPPEPSYILPSQTQPIQPPTQPAPYPGTHQESIAGTLPEAPSAQPHPPYGTQGSPPDPNWRSETQQMVDARPARGRGSRGGRGPGSRGGRVRKSMQGHHHPHGSPDWERDQWSAVPDTRGSPGAYESHAAQPGRSIVRRGGGGSGSRVGSMPMERSNEWTPEIGPRTIYHNQDSPIEVKKTRSKPVRNEDGILVRKDGRPDRRSQSSAANLRKVHARKEEQQREAEAGLTPTGSRLTVSAGLETPSPISRDSQEHDVTDSVRKKHHDILGRMFPEGLDSSRKQHDYAHQVFNEDRDHTAHPRSQVVKPVQAAPPVKKEKVERTEVAETQVPTNRDVEVGDAETPNDGRKDGDSQTPSREAVNTAAQQTQNREGAADESNVQISETQAIDSSATLAAQSIETA